MGRILELTNRPKIHPLMITEEQQHTATRKNLKTTYQTPAGCWRSTATMKATRPAISAAWILQPWYWPTPDQLVYQGNRPVTGLSGIFLGNHHMQGYKKGQFGNFECLINSLSKPFTESVAWTSLEPARILDWNHSKTLWSNGSHPGSKDMPSIFASRRCQWEAFCCRWTTKPNVGVIQGVLRAGQGTMLDHTAVAPLYGLRLVTTVTVTLIMSIVGQMMVKSC